MVTRMIDGRKIELSWRELSEILSKAHVLGTTEDIANLTLTKPRTLLIQSGFPVKDTPLPPAKVTKD